MHLPSIQTDQQNYSLFQFDQAPHLAETLGLDLSLEDNVELIRSILQKMNQELNSEISGMVVDPIYSFDLISDKSKATGIIFRLATLNAEVDPLVVPTLLPDWSIEDISNNFSLAKLQLYYHPQSESALDKKQLVAELYDYCQYQRISFMLELVIYTPAEKEFDETEFQQDQLEAIQEFRGVADILALQYPLGPLAAATITAELDIPWILASQGQKYQDLKQVLRVCLENGAKGVLADKSLWQELGEFKKEDQSPDLDVITEFIKTDLRDRMIELTRIIDENSKIN
jgi:tagatose-1,6-bisphosphate aldolase